MDHDQGVISDRNYQNHQLIVLSEQAFDSEYVEHDQGVNNDSNEFDIYEIGPERIPTPNGHKYWVSDVPVNEKPKERDVFATFDEAYNMYKVYAAKARFCVRKSGTKSKNGQITHKHLVCHRVGKPRKLIDESDAEDQQDVEDELDDEYENDDQVMEHDEDEQQDSSGEDDEYDYDE